MNLVSVLVSVISFLVDIYAEEIPQGFWDHVGLTDQWTDQWTCQEQGTRHCERIAGFLTCISCVFLLFEVCFGLVFVLFFSYVSVSCGFCFCSASSVGIPSLVHMAKSTGGWVRGNIITHANFTLKTYFSYAYIHVCVCVCVRT